MTAISSDALRCAAGAAAVVMAVSSPAGASWSEFRGPNGAGVADSDAPPPIAFGSPAWSVAVPPGLSSPITAADDLVIVTGIENNRLAVLAFSRSDGALRWRKLAPKVPLEPVHETGSPAASTPCADKSRIYVYFGSFGLIALTLDGEEAWTRPIPPPKSLYGTSTSPIVSEGRLYLALDDDANLDGSQLSRSKLLALDAGSGKTIWEAARPFNRSGWSTPTIWEHDAGPPEIVVLGSGRAAGYDLTDGRELWRLDGFSRETIARPVTGDGRVYLSAAMLGGVADEQPDPAPFWDAVLGFDANADGMLERAEMTDPFTFPLRPELPPGHPGFGIPLPKDPARRAERLDGMFASIDRDRDGFWEKDEFLAGMTFDRGTPRLVAVTPGGRGDLAGADQVAWELNRSIPEIPTPLFYDGRIYLARSGGLVTAVRAETGEIIYRERVDAPGHCSASPVAAADHIYLVSSRGRLTALKAGDTLDVAHSADLGEPVHVTPAIDRDTIFIRTESSLRAYRR